MNYKDLLKLIISEFFSESNFDLYCKLKWLPVTEREKERYFRKSESFPKPQSEWFLYRG